MTNLVTNVESVVADHPDEPALVFRDKEFSYREFWAQTGQFAAALREHGVGKTTKSSSPAHQNTECSEDVDKAAFRERVTSIRDEAGIDRDEAVAVVEDTLASWCDANEGEWTDEELEAARELAEEKYATDEWTRERVS